ncbi:ParB N-terminal domain-containing protein [Ruficoccus amylovorans]|uniref:ParB N-terminal domain-containing protein n=1 Tax=Ruficoccus amylovorans TaxID=1804625 RepID=A0A842HDW0_9BACT|nr:ParB N-terminal domain-containing protein [Ruficoccus amylovorans]MBC2593767.1 ParB N-terminal domain-containing protein [Ruficoccus amylovorans]
MSNVTLESIDAVQPSAYNPRSADAERLDLIELSLRKLGFLAPIFADSNGEILSGHQRHLVASRMGATQIPVFRTKSMPIAQRKALNIVFNRATNDFDWHTTPEKATRELASLDVHQFAESIPDKAVDSPEFIRCLRPSLVSVKELCRANANCWLQYARNLARTLHRQGILMPLVCRRDGTVVNGIGRLEMMAEKKFETAPVVYVSDEEADFARAMMNLLSMDFDVHTRYADLLRYNSFRRARRVREELGNGFIFAVHGSKPCHSFDIFNPKQRAAWVREHGTSILDFGAGHLTETKMLRRAGLSVTPFEPYHITRTEIDKARSLELVREFLQAVGEGTEWTSIFLASVLNSVPFQSDREHIAVLLTALCKPHTKVYACASSVGETGWRQVNGKAFLNKSNSGNIAFRLDYEPGVRIGDFQEKPKVQKYHTQKEFHQLWTPFYRSVSIRELSNNITAKCEHARPVDIDRLLEAITFEFDLPYPDGSRMGLVDLAREAFSKRLGVAI